MTLAGVALLIAIVGVVLAAGSLIWQVTVFIRSGHRVKVELMVGYVADVTVEATKGGGVTVLQVMATPHEWSADVRARTPPTQHYFVKAVNAGRSGVWINSVGFAVDERLAIQVHSSKHDEAIDMPTYLEAGQTRVFRYPVAAITTAFLRDASDDVGIHAVIELGTGKEIRTKESVRAGLVREIVEREGQPTPSPDVATP